MGTSHPALLVLGCLLAGMDPCLLQVRYPWGKSCFLSYVFWGVLAVLCTNSPKEWREVENYRTLSKVTTDLQFPLH